MTVVINGRPYEMQAGQTVWDALVLVGITEPRGVAAAVEAEVIPKGLWQTTELSEGQTLEIVRAVQGG